MTFVNLIRRATRRSSLARFITLGGLLLGTSTAVLVPSQSVRAADQLYLTYGPIQRSLSVAELRHFADTGETTRQLRWYLNVANLAPEDFRQVLTQEISLDLKTVDRIGNTIPGEFVLFEVGQVLHTQSHRANIQALRAALVLSASADNRISIIEFLENYPTPALYVDGVILAQIARDVKGVIHKIQPVVLAVEEFLQGLICECETQSTTSTPR